MSWEWDRASKEVGDKWIEKQRYIENQRKETSVDYVTWNWTEEQSYKNLFEKLPKYETKFHP